MKSTYLAGLAGSLVALIASIALGNGDAIQNTAEKMRTLFQMSDGARLSITIVLMVIIVVLGIVVCWVYSPPNKADAFVRGCSTLVLLSLSPNTAHNNQIPVSTMNNHSPGYHVTETPSFSSTHKDVSPIKAVSLIYLDSEIEQGYSPNAKVIYNEWISTCKPSTGLGSFFFNTITICKNNDKLNKDEEIQVLNDYYDTPVKSYRYLHIRYLRGNAVKEGWIYSGKKPDYYSNVSLYKDITTYLKE
jgi:hypothetical protein